MPIFIGLLYMICLKGGCVAVIIVTNNPLSREAETDITVEYIDDGDFTGYMSVLVRVRDLIHLGHRLLTHPLSGSVKPGETPYKTVAMTAEQGELDPKSLDIIENSVETARKLIANRKDRILTEKIRKDFQLIDYQLIFSK